MRGTEEIQDSMFSYISAEQRVPKDHPLRPVRKILDESLKRLSEEFEGMYSSTGRPSIAPEKLLRALVLQALYTVRSERMLMEQLDYNLLFRWFVGLEIDDPVWDVTVFTKNRERLLKGEHLPEPAQRDRWPNNFASWLRGKSEETETSRRNLRLDEDDRCNAPNATSR